MSNQRVEQKTAFNSWCDAFNIEPERRDRLWKIMLEQAMTPDDVNTYFLGASGVLEKVADLVTDATDKLPRNVEAASKRAVAQVAEAATRKVEERHADLAARTGKDVGKAAAEYFEQEANRQRIRVSGVVTACALVVALAFLGAGYWIGVWSLGNLEASVQALASRSDIRTVLRVLAGNPDLTATINGWCGSGSNRVVVAEGVRNCTLPLWIDGRATVSPAAAGATPFVNLWSGGIAFLNGFHPLTLVAGGLVVGVLLRKLLAGFQAIPGMKWLTS